MYSCELDINDSYQLLLNKFLVNLSSNKKTINIFSLKKTWSEKKKIIVEKRNKNRFFKVYLNYLLQTKRNKF